MAETVKLNFDTDRLTINDWITIEEWRGASARAVRDFLAHLVVDPETDEPLPEDMALAAVGKMTGAQLGETMNQFVASLKKAKDSASGEALGS
ncbi:MAG: hypothetical protein EHM35_04450 [Planctomycetaceae bacterium]|nr:MAG: hypothetical protein EHM35_04450 [Planctomycetaceae bacterium]